MSTISASSQPLLLVRDLSHRYGAIAVLQGLSLAVAPGEVICLAGPSGCGKSTLLRLIAGLEPVQAGSIEIDGRTLASPGIHLAPERREVGMVFQDLALFPHLSALENAAFGLGGLARSERTAAALRMLERVGLADRAAELPHRLSGGQQQRVALARALVTKPRLLLLDEPFSSLDVGTRRQMQREATDLLKSNGITTLLVTHDPEEAMMMADRVALMEAGRIAQLGTPAELYGNPADGYVASFFGEVNRMAGIVAGGAIATPLGPIAAPALSEGARADIRIRPEAILPAAPDARIATAARVTAARLLGGSALLEILVENGSSQGTALQMRLTSREMVEAGAVIRVSLDPRGVFVFPA
ncbi:MAG TPA: ABC transporter ATP-binding protein [Hypericibacter adhaerens]|jgi:iron(III) transport system ATP-binding protein|uniref:ABC transporter ATP-binding protein n=1 Tax=Hypericibacter adhaerens TaxID=2602016 RepID=UPI002BED3CB7|nr:ABC transporter ATP-binding protein [Hypericibacter adhaerens]HWA45204.1 ABC transporter ATP-binding protein [Hypericibacter adhaerens]